jgi:hypothetical protein
MSQIAARRLCFSKRLQVFTLLAIKEVQAGYTKFLFLKGNLVRPIDELST